MVSRAEQAPFSTMPRPDGRGIVAFMSSPWEKVAKIVSDKRRVQRISARRITYVYFVTGVSLGCKVSYGAIGTAGEGVSQKG